MIKLRIAGLLAAAQFALAQAAFASPPVDVPEPATLGLLAAAIGGLSLLRKRK